MGENITDISERAKAVATEASKQGNFNFLDRLTGRNYPTEEVAVYLDEAAGYALEKVEDELTNARARAKLFKDSKEVLAEITKEILKLEEQRDAIREAAQASRFVFHLEGISTGDYDKVVDAARDAHPYEYRESRNPLTFALEREVIGTDERDVYFRTHLWAKFIRRVVDPDGNEDANISPAWVAQVLDLLPTVGQVKIQEAVDALRMTTSWMDNIQGEDFLAKS